MEIQTFDELQPCPFCGTKPNIELAPLDGFEFKMVVCQCGVRGSRCDSYERAISAWNRRTTNDSLSAMRDAAEMLWVTLANVSGGDWTQQSPEWQEAAAKWREAYFEAEKACKYVTPRDVV